MCKIILIGAGDLGRQIAHWIKSDNLFNIVGFADDVVDIGTVVDGIRVVCKIHELEHLYKSAFFDKILIAIGYNHFELRNSIFDYFNGKIPFATFIHSTCFVDKSARIADGCVLYPHCFVDQGVIINNNVLVNVCSVLGHNCEIDNHTFIAAKVLIGGNAFIGKKCMIGNGVTTTSGVKISDRCIVGCGAVVLKNLLKTGVYIGNPASFYSELFE